jgi:NAD(P)H-dependent flavin oxidoreductase YrpB (nitropropane dioxygenase family)
MGGEPDLHVELDLAKSEKFGVGFITWALGQAPHMLMNALKYSPFCVFISFGNPGPFAEEVHKAGALLICQVQFMSDIAFGSQSARYSQARVQDDLDTVAVVCGEAVGMIQDRPSAEAIVTTMAAQAEKLLRSGVEEWLSS